MNLSIKIEDRKTGLTYEYYVLDVPPKIVLVEQTQTHPDRFVYTISTKEEGKRIQFEDFIPILFFDLGFDTVPKVLKDWVDTLVP